MGSNCCPYDDLIAAYVVGETTPEETELLQKHIAACPSCRKEAESLRQSWQMIPFQLEEVEPPADLKAEVMRGIFEAEQSKERPGATRSRKSWFQPSYKLASAALLLLLAGTLWQNFELRQRLSLAEAQSAVPAAVVREYSLKPADTAVASAKGMVWLYEQGGRKTLVFRLEGLPATRGTEAYQVWLIRDGQRSSAGVFRVDSRGNGVLTCELSEQTASFQAIGITLEPDANGVQPRGKRMLKM
ncbi:anti-sigma factor domain-containing protein [Brevibacillus sp. H7]|uniref:anti-sigma factor n=1 Tax=Brevibacillus sp. H7 TaxID=3349138 RepID=UPI003830B675